MGQNHWNCLKLFACIFPHGSKIFVAMHQFSGPKGDPGRRRDYVPEMQCFKDFGDEMISNTNLDATVLHSVFCVGSIG